MALPQDTSFKKRYPTLEQNEVLNATASAVLVSALAGTGKTTTLAIKAADLVRAKASSRILMLAYSEAGLTAIAQRLAKLMPAIPRQVQIMTVEQLCATVLTSQGDALVRVTEPLQRALLVRQAHASLIQSVQQGHHTTAPEMAEFLSRDLDIQAFLGFEALAKQQLLTREIEHSGLGALAYCREYELDYGLYQLFARYERLRRGMNHEPEFYAPGDCTYEVAQQLCTLDAGDTFAPLRDRFDAVLFDELQDLDEAAMRVLRYVVQGHNGLFVGAGDFNQHILPGALSVFGNSQARIRQELPADTQVVSINTTYRFGSAICNALNPLFGVQFAAHYASKPAWFEQRSYSDDEDCARQLLAIHDTVQNQPPPARPVPGPSAPACLTVVLRSPEDSVLLEWMFAHEGVHYACKGMKRFYQRREVALVIAILWAMQGCCSSVRLTQGILSSAIEGLLHCVRRGSQPDQDVLANGVFDMQALQGDSPVELDTRAVAAELIDKQHLLRQFLVRASFDPGAPVASALCEQLLALPVEACADAGALCNHPLLQQFFAQAPLSADELRACQDGLKALARIGKGLSVDEFLGRIAFMGQTSIEQHGQQEAPSLQLLTVERCKGHEYDYVAVPWVERGRFPRSAAQHDAYRERNMLYVAMTRASKRLWLLESSKRPVSPGPV